MKQEILKLSEVWDGTYKGIEDFFNNLFPKYNFKMRDAKAVHFGVIKYTLTLYADNYALISMNYFRHIHSNESEECAYKNHINGFIKHLIETMTKARYNNKSIYEALGNKEFKGWNY